MISSIQKRTISFFVVIALTLGIFVALPSGGVVYADAKSEACAAIGDSKCSGGTSSVQTLIKNIINVLSAIGGIIAVIMVIIGGFKFVTSGGDSNASASARNTIIYALVGLIIIAFAQIIVQFVLQRIG